jgi:hypothetical protein
MRIKYNWIVWALIITVNLLVASATLNIKNLFKKPVKIEQIYYQRYVRLIRENDSLQRVMSDYRGAILRSELKKETGITIPGYFPDNCIDSMLKWGTYYGVPNRIQFRLVYRESCFTSDEESMAGATGLYQLMPSTVRRLTKEGLPASDYQMANYLLSKYYKEEKSWAQALHRYLTGKTSKNPEGTSYVRFIIKDLKNE